MDLIYNVVWSTAKPLKSNLCGKVVVAWSCRNLIAFSTGYRKLNASEGSNSSCTNEQNSRTQIINGIHILDPDSPWDVCSFSSGHKELIQSLTWDGTASRLLSTDLVGVCKIWAMKDHMVNDWECVLTVDVGEGERLVALSWIDTGIKNLFVLCGDDPQHSVMPKKLSDRFKTNQSKPPLVEIGGMRAKDGWVAISETGLICVTTIKPEVQITRKCLAQVRTRVAVADLAFTSKGKVIVVANDGELCSAVQFYRVSLSGGPDGCRILSDPLPCLFPHSHSEQDFSEYRVNNVQFLSKNSGEAILVCTTGKAGSCIKRWEMKKGKIHLHERFQQEMAAHLLSCLPNYSVYEWTIINTYKDHANIVSLCLPRLPTPKIDFSPISNILTYPASILLVQYDDDRLQLLTSVGLLPSASFRTPVVDTDVGTPTKRARISGVSYSTGCLGAISYSPCCCCMVGLTMTGDLRMFKLHHLSDSVDHGGLRLKRSLKDLLQYCLLTGWEWWDVLMAAHLGTQTDTLDAVLRMLTDDFSMQDIPQQQIHGSRLRAIKASLFRCMKDGAGQAVDCYVRQLLMAIAATIRSLLRSSLSAGDQLAKMSTISDVEVDKVIQALDAKELTLESTTLLSLFPLIQWLTDLALFVVVAFTSHHNKETAPGVSLIRDTSTLGTLREMLVLIRLWGQTTPGVLPSITPSADKNESLALLFKVFTKIWLLSRQASSDESEDRLAAEAAPLIPNSLFLPNMQIPNLNRGVSGKAVSGQIKPSLYQFGTQPVVHTARQIFHPFASAIFPMSADGSHTMDVVRRIFLDKSPETKLKQCTRCNCVSMVDGISDHAAAKAWEQRWVRACVCGGSWRRLSFKEQQSVPAAND